MENESRSNWKIVVIFSGNIDKMNGILLRAHCLDIWQKDWLDQEKNYPSITNWEKLSFVEMKNDKNDQEKLSCYFQNTAITGKETNQLKIKKKLSCYLPKN